MRPGEAKHFGSIQQATESGAGGGTVTTAWTALFDCWARIRPIRGREFFDGQTVEVEHWVRITIWYRPDVEVTEGMSFLHSNGTRYLFRDVANVENKELEIMAVQRA